MYRTLRYTRIPPSCGSPWRDSRGTVYIQLHRPDRAGSRENRISPDIQRRSQHTAADNIPRVARPSLWISLIPSFLREKRQPSKQLRPRQTNPATFFIVIFLLIGSQAIQSIALRHEFAAYTRHADVKIALLREVIRKVQQGEDVDVEGLLGTGNKAMEKEWEEVLKDLEQEDLQWQSKSRQRRKEEEALEETTKDTPGEGASREPPLHQQAQNPKNSNKNSDNGDQRQTKQSGSNKNKATFY